MPLRFFDKWASKRQTKELAQFVQGLQAADGGEIGLVVACATDWRHRLRSAGIDLMYPAVCLLKDPMLTFKLSRKIQELQRNQQQHLAAGLMVWVHTLRSLDRLELRNLGRSMWKELARGFGHAEEAAAGFFEFSGTKFDTTDCSQFPDGLTPAPI